jgi:DNA polymerase sigma
MRLNKNTYPAFEQLERGEFHNLQIDQMFNTILKDADGLLDFLKSISFTYKQVNRKYYFTNTFKDAIRTAIPKIIDKNKHINDIPSDCGMIFTDKGFTVYLSNPTDKKLKLLCFGFTKDTLTTYGMIDNDGNFGGLACSLKDGKPYNDIDELNTYLNSTLISLYFIHNCETDQKIIKPNEKHRENGNKHFNESKSDIIFLDCNWFTELIRNTPFHVKGHLRWQHHGEKFTKRKLIWISDFEKSGYQRKARKELILEN